MYNSTEPQALNRAEPCYAAALRYVSRVLLGGYDDAIRESGLTIAQLDLLATVLTHNGPLRPTDLGQLMAMSRSTVTRDLARLQRDQLVTLMPGNSGRELRVAVTEQGKQAVLRALPGWATAQKNLRGRLGANGIQALLLVYEKLKGGEASHDRG